MGREKETASSFLDKLLRFFLEKKVVALLMVLFVIVWGAIVSPFVWDSEFIERDPVPVDAIPDIGENQQIVFSEWMGRSPQDVEDQIGYPLTVALLGVPGVKTIRSYSMLGFSTIYVIFEEDVDFYWSRSRVLEKLSSLSAGALPQGVQPALGPDATALGQVFWYTLEGRDESGEPTGGWDLHELRSIQDWQVRYSLLGAKGVSEVASVGGFVQEYQIDVDPDAMRAYGVSIAQVFEAVRMANRDVGARTIEINRVEYVIRGIGFVKELSDLEDAVITARDNVPIYVKNVARVHRGPALRRGALDKGGAEAVGGVVVVRYGENPLAAIENVKRKIEEIAPGLPKKTLADGRVSQVQIVPFYDRTGLILETLGTLDAALSEEILVTIIVILVMVMHLRSAALVSGLLPLAVLLCFVAMKVFGVDANIVALSGIAIAIGTMVDMGVVICENILKHLDEADEGEDRIEVVYRAVREVSGAILTAVLTTVVSFLPVFVMEGAEGKLFKPLAFTKTFALLAAIWLSLTVLPALAQVLLAGRVRTMLLRRVALLGLVLVGALLVFFVPWWLAFLVAAPGLYHLVQDRLPALVRRFVPVLMPIAVALFVTAILAEHWLPLGPERGSLRNALFVVLLIGGLLALFLLYQRVFSRLLRWSLDHKVLSTILPFLLVIMGGLSWLGFDALLSFMPRVIRLSSPVASVAQAFPGLGKEFMPTLDEGSFLWMPTTMPHASIGEALDVLQKQDIAIEQIPEIESAVGKLGRAETPLDPAPISMIETIVNYKSEYLVDEQGRRLRFKFVEAETDFYRTAAGEEVAAADGESYTVRGRFVRDTDGRLLPDDGGQTLSPVASSSRSRAQSRAGRVARNRVGR
jgi:Cu(I)/Ag(I) efflux system membrane protein CusA/SilA